MVSWCDDSINLKDIVGASLPVGLSVPVISNPQANFLANGITVPGTFAVTGNSLEFTADAMTPLPASSVTNGYRYAPWVAWDS